MQLNDVEDEFLWHKFTIAGMMNPMMGKQY